MAKSIPGWYTPSPCVTGIVFPAVKNHSTSRCFSGWSKNLWKQTSAEPSTQRCFDHFRWKNNGKSCHTKQSSIKHWWLPTVISPVSLLFTKSTKVCSFTEFQLQIVFSESFNNTRNSRGWQKISLYQRLAKQRYVTIGCFEAGIIPFICCFWNDKTRNTFLESCLETGK